MIVKEGDMLDINCTSSIGYPYPNITITLSDSVGSTLPVSINSLRITLTYNVSSCNLCIQ